MKREQLLQHIHAKEPEAFRELFKDFYPTLVQFAMSYVDSQDIAEDIVQEIFVSVWEKDYHYPSYNAFRSFLYSSVRNSGLKYLRHKNVREKYLAQLKTEGETPPDDIDLKIMEEELYRLLFATIDELPEKCRNIFLLSLEGKGNEEISQLLKLSVLTVKTQKKRAMKFIRERLGLFYLLLLPWGTI